MRARELWQEVTKIRPQEEIAWERVAKLLYDKGNTASAIKSLAVGLKRNAGKCGYELSIGIDDPSKFWTDGSGGRIS